MKITDAYTAAERNALRRERVQAAGGRRIEAILDAETSRALDLLLRASNTTLRETVSALIRAEAARIRPRAR